MDSLFRFIVLKSKETKKNASFKNDGVHDDLVRCNKESVFSPCVKIEVEISKISNKYVHLRFCHTNKYWRRAPTDKWIIASSDQKVEDESDPACTLFEPNFSHGQDNVVFTHIKSGGRVRVDAGNSCIYVDTNNYGSYDSDHFRVVDWDKLVKLPKYITLKGDNDKYLQAKWYDGKPWRGGYPYLEFSGEDFNHEYAAYEVYLQPDGYIRFKSVHYQKFWRRSYSWIYGDSSDGSGKDINTLFWPVKLDDNTIALRNAGNDEFCKRLTLEGKKSVLAAATNYITREARLTVEELVLERSIYNVGYRMEDARIYDETPFLVGIGTATNNSNTESNMAIKALYTITSSSSFTHTTSLTLAVKTTIKAGIPFILNGEIKVSSSVTETLAWNKTNTKTKTLEVTYTVKVPPMSRATVNYVATKGNCSVPFSYYQRDKRSSNGTFVITQHDDGIFNGVDYYSYSFEQLQFEPI